MTKIWTPPPPCLSLLNLGHPFCNCLILFSFLSNKSIHTAQNAKLTCTQIAYEKVGTETSVLIIAKKLPRGQIKDSLYLEAATGRYISNLNLSWILLINSVIEIIEQKEIYIIYSEHLQWLLLSVPTIL